MTKYNENSGSRAEKLIESVFRGREFEADAQIARLRFENQLNSLTPRPRVRSSIKVIAFLTGLMLLGGWASGLTLQSIDDAQQITLRMPGELSIEQYNYWTANFANHADELQELGGHSLVVDVVGNTENEYYLQLGIIGINYSDANSWIRKVMEEVPELSGTAYVITQPLVPYSVTVGDMLAYRLGSTNPIERNVVRAWYSIDEFPSHVYLIARADGNFRTAQRFLY